LRVVEPGGNPYGAVHDIQIMVEGDAAARLGDVVRERWMRFNGKPPKKAAGGGDLWPDDIAPDFTNVDVGIARTLPRWAVYPAVTEVDALTADAILAAQTLIYIENQYLTSPRVAKLLARRLSQTEGPDVLIVVSQKYGGTMERFVMGRNRQRMIRRLRGADKYGRLHVLCPVLQHGDEQCTIKVHSKLMIVDDIFLRIGSANLNNRSMGLDTECDVAIEGREPDIRKAIERIREQLLAEHVGATADDVRNSLISHRSMLSGLDALNHGERRLIDLMHVGKLGPTRPVFLTFLMDPIRPLVPHWVSRIRRALGRRLTWLAKRVRKAASPTERS
jgi:phosphatidylserine/phosphatidylglycerophosphate/cardiolipin synthase-like enzyme